MRTWHESAIKVTCTKANPLRTNLQNNRFNSVCMQGSLTAVLVSRFASWWQEEPNIIKIIKRHYLTGVRVWRGGQYGERRPELCISF